ANRNNGAKYAKGVWLVFFDDDVEPNKNIISAYKNALEVNTFTLVLEGSTKADRKKKRLDEECPINLSGGCLWSCNFVINRVFFLSILKGFDERFP
ncbi:glycosyltransferase, partial [Acinetobacter baumannii]